MPITKAVKLMIQSQVQKARNCNKNTYCLSIRHHTEPQAWYSYGISPSATLRSVEQLHNVDWVQNYLDPHTFPYLHTIVNGVNLTYILLTSFFNTHPMWFWCQHVDTHPISLYTKPN
jgi:hypothetical protein